MKRLVVVLIAIALPAPVWSQTERGLVGSWSFSSSLAFDGSWRHLAIVLEQPCYYLYVDGVLCETGRLSLPITPTNGAGRFIGGWSAGYFHGVIVEWSVS